MVLKQYSQIVHDDGKHSGSAKRGIANGVAGLDASALISDAVIPGLANTYVISDDLLHSHDAVASTQTGDYVKLKTITLNALHSSPVTLRIKFDMKTSYFVDDAWGWVLKNGSTNNAGTERSTASIDYITYSEDISY